MWDQSHAWIKSPYVEHVLLSKTDPKSWKKSHSFSHLTSVDAVTELRSGVIYCLDLDLHIQVFLCTADCTMYLHSFEHHVQ